MSKKYLKKNVLEAATERIDWALTEFPAFYVSFSGGKDSGVLLNLVIERASKLGKLPVPTMFFDWETCYKGTVDFVRRMMERPEVEPYWLCIPECEDNGSSIFERFWKPWDRSKKDLWVRPMPDMPYVINEDNLPEEWRSWYNPNDYSMWVVKHFGDWLAEKKGADSLVNFIGMRTLESYGRHMLIAAGKNRVKKNHYTYQTKDNGARTWISLPIYDWAVEDVWAANGKFEWDYNRTYDRFYYAGSTLQEMRICNALGESQKQDLDMWQVVEPETWDRLVQRVQGANFGAMYNKTNLNRLRTLKPENSTWEEYTQLLLESLPPDAKANFEDKFRIIFNWFENYSRKKQGLEKYMFDTRKEAKAFAKEHELSICYVGSWETLANFIIKRDWVCKKYGFAISEKTTKHIEGLMKKYEDL